jgi:hypothetical protein
MFLPGDIFPTPRISNPVTSEELFPEEVTLTLFNPSRLEMFCQINRETQRLMREPRRTMDRQVGSARSCAMKNCSSEILFYPKLWSLNAR